MSKPLSGIELKRFLKHRYSHDLDLIVILENIQYARNVAEVFRIGDATKIGRIILTGISQKPPFGKDLQKVSRTKEHSIPWEYFATTKEALTKVKQQGYLPVALEITEDATDLIEFLQETYPNKLAIIVGNEGYGITRST